MLKFTLSFTLILLLHFYSASSESASYDHLGLAQSWPQTNCWYLNKRWDECSPCKRPITGSNEWTLHGLWPSSAQQEHPFFCNRKNPVISSALRAEMTLKWPTYNMNMTDEKFWNYEYKKHGTCALDLDETSTSDKYFKTALQLLDQYNAKHVLDNAGIYPGAKYSLNNIYYAFKNELGVGVYVSCAYSMTTDEPHLSEIRICFNKAFKLIDCPDKKISNCRSNTKINYPASKQPCD